MSKLLSNQYQVTSSLEDPIFSIIMPSYNNEQYIGEAISSVINQSEKRWELIIVDDASTDNSIETIRRYKTIDPRIRLIRNEKNEGPGASRNKAIKIAVGKWIAFLDADDLWVDTKLERQLSFVSSIHSDMVFSHSAYGYLDQKGNIVEKTFQVSSFPVNYKQLLKRTEISCLTAIYNQNEIGKYYMSTHRYKQDYALWLAILKRGYKSFPQQEVLAYYRQTSNSGNRRNLGAIRSHINFLITTQGLNIFESVYYTAFWIINGITRYFLR